MMLANVIVDMGKTTIPVSDGVADELHDLKGRGQTYDSVLRDLLECQDHDEAET